MEGLPLGLRYRDTVTGIEGVATSRHEYQYGCVRYTLEWATHDKVETKAETFDEQRLELVAASEVDPERAATSGGPQDTPVRPSTPTR